MKTVRTLQVLIVSMIIASGHLPAQTPSGSWILKKVDDNIGSDNKIVVAEMIVTGRRNDRSFKSKSWVRGIDQSFTEYLGPSAEEGTKMLKLGDQLWTYSPSTDRTIRISGHMLRQSVMGSDLSYEDMMEDPRLENLYEATVIGEESFLERPCWVIELRAKEGMNVTYHSRKIWVDKERFVSLKEDRYAKSGILLKTTEVKEVSLIQNRWVPSKVAFRDALKRGGGTEFTIISIEFNAQIPDHIFSKASLRK